jgi:hypothetical protein
MKIPKSKDPDPKLLQPCSNKERETQRKTKKNKHREYLKVKKEKEKGGFCHFDPNT